jgi:polyisoprenoid-binding protein YceI
MPDRPCAVVAGAPARKLAGAAMALAVVAAVLAYAPLAQSAPDVFRVEPGMTSVEFGVSHLGISRQRGTFDQTWGRIELDGSRSTGRIDFVVDAASVNTGWSVRDAFIRGEDMFDVEQHPVMRFRSTRLDFDAGVLQRIDGDLTLHGITREVTFAVTRLDCGTDPATGRAGCGAEATGTIRRSDFGMSYALPLIGDEIDLRFLVTAFAVPLRGEADTF